MMLEPLSTTGHWWLPDNPTLQLPGTLEYDLNGGAALTLIGALYDYTLPQEAVTLFGRLVTGVSITLFQCFITDLTTYSAGSATCSVRSHFGIIGGHYATPSVLQPIKVTAEMTYFYDWVGRTGVRHTKDGIAINQPNRFNLGRCNETEIDVKFSQNIRHRNNKTEIVERCFVVLKSPNPHGYLLFTELLQIVQQFVALGVGHPVYSLNVEAEMPCPDRLGQKRIQLIYNTAQRSTLNRPLFASEMTFALKDLGVDVASYLNSFCNKYSRLKPVCELYFSTLYNQDMYAHQRFLAICHGVEAYHRRFIGGKYQSDTDYQNGIKRHLENAIPDTIDKGFRVSLKNRLKYLNEYSLRKRIQDICLQRAPFIRAYLEDISSFADRVATLRNDLTHQGGDENNNREEVELSVVVNYSDQMEVLLQACLLHEAGFSNEKVAELLNRNRRVRAFQHYNQLR